MDNFNRSLLVTFFSNRKMWKPVLCIQSLMDPELLPRCRSGIIVPDISFISKFMPMNSGLCVLHW